MRFRLRSSLEVLSFLALLGAAACSDSQSPEMTQDDVTAETIRTFALAPLPRIPYPPNNPPIAERVSLGKLLFFDPILGGESAPWVKEAAGLDPYRFRGNDVSCATCHHPAFGFSDGRRLPAGVGGAQFSDMDLGPARVFPGRSIVTGEPVGVVPRNSPTILNTAFNGLGSHVPTHESFMFMDGRVEGGLEEQARKPIGSRDEMAGDAFGPTPDLFAEDSVVARLRANTEYVARFAQAFPAEIGVANDITIDHVARAIASYERELVTPNSRYDRFVAGDRSAFNAQELAGFDLFFGKGLCGDCHGGAMLSDFTMRIQGVGDGYEQILPGFEGKSGTGTDLGRFHADPDRFAGEMYAFRTLTVRNVEVTAPYFHSGSAATLEEVVEFYNRGGLGPEDISEATLSAAGVVRDPSIRPLGLTPEEVDAIVAFMKTTTAPVRPGPGGMDLTEVPYRVPSGLVPPGMPTPSGAGPFLDPKDEPR